MTAPVDLDAVEREAHALVATVRRHCYASDADKLDALLVTAFAELRAARETNRALEGIAEAAEAYLTARGKPWFESHAHDALRALKARLAERGK